MTSIQFKNPKSFTYNDNDLVDHYTRATIKRYLQFIEMDLKCTLTRLPHTDVYLIYVDGKHIWDFNPFEVDGNEMTIAVQTIRDEHMMNSYN
jgi:hypothetical protein